MIFGDGDFYLGFKQGRIDSMKRLRKEILKNMEKGKESERVGFK